MMLKLGAAVSFLKSFFIRKVKVLCSNTSVVNCRQLQSAPVFSDFPPAVSYLPHTLPILL